MDKGNYRHFMAKEIHEQPEVVGHTLAHYLDLVDLSGVVTRTCPLDFSKIDTPVAVGVRHRVSMRAFVAKYWFERWAKRLPVDVDIASEFRYREIGMDPGAVRRVFVSQSGETADTLASLRYCRRARTST